MRPSGTRRGASGRTAEAQHTNQRKGESAMTATGFYTGRMVAITERAERGAAMLDKKRPGWWQLIDLGTLDVSSDCNCIAGQLGSYGTVMLALDLFSSSADAACGFET